MVESYEDFKTHVSCLMSGWRIGVEEIGPGRGKLLKRLL